jgi:hypothetical protein
MSAQELPTAEELSPDMSFDELAARMNGETVRAQLQEINRLRLLLGRISIRVDTAKRMPSMARIVVNDIGYLIEEAGV